jgi:hypothetical protein
VELSGDRIVGRLIPEQQVDLEVRGQDRTITVRADPLGRFTAGPLSAGPVSLRLDTKPSRLRQPRQRLDTSIPEVLAGTGRKTSRQGPCPATYFMP